VGERSRRNERRGTQQTFESHFENGNKGKMTNCSIVEERYSISVNWST